MSLDQVNSYDKSFILNQLNSAEAILSKSDQEILESENRLDIVKTINFLKSKYSNTDLYKFLVDRYSKLEKSFSFKNKYGLLDSCPSITIWTNSYKIEVVSGEWEKIWLKVSNMFETLIINDVPKTQKAVDDLLKSLMVDENFGKTWKYSGEWVIKSYNEIFELDRAWLETLIKSVNSQPNSVVDLWSSKSWWPNLDSPTSSASQSNAVESSKKNSPKKTVQRHIESNPPKRNKPKKDNIRPVSNTSDISKKSSLWSNIIKEINFSRLWQYPGIDRKDINELKDVYRTSWIELDISENWVSREINSKKYELLGKINWLWIDIVVAKDDKWNLYAFKYNWDKLDYYWNIESNKIVLYSELGESIKSTDIRLAAQNIAFLELALESVTKDVKTKIHKAPAPVETKENSLFDLKDKVTRSCNELMNMDENKYKLEKKKYLTTIFDNISAIWKSISLDKNDILLPYSELEKNKLLRLWIDMDSEEVQKMIRNSTILIEKKISKINIPYWFLLKCIEREITSL